MSLVLSFALGSVKYQSRLYAPAGVSSAILPQPDYAALLAQPLAIGSLLVPNRVFSAPMSGVSDLPYQNLALAGGAGLVFTEMAAANLLAAEAQGPGLQQAETRRRLATADTGQSGAATGYSAVQLFGRAPEAMAAAARSAQAAGAKLIDINMGCPAKKLAMKQGGFAACGAALMRDEGLALAIIEAVLGAVSVPVSVKMRLGWDEDSINAPSLASKAAAAGAAMITVHARTRAQFYCGKADWAAVYAVRAAMDKALIINGDITDLQSAAAAMRLSGADGVMIGRGGCGQPWLAGLLAGGQAPRNIGAYILAHYRAMLGFYGAARGLRHARKHIDWYLQKQAAGLYSAAERAELMAALAPEEAAEKLAEIFARAGEARSCGGQSGETAEQAADS